MSYKTLVIALSSDRLDVLGVRGGRVQSSRRLPVSLPNDPTEWVRSVRSLAERVRRAAEEIRFSGASARVLYSSPTLAVEQVSVNMKRAADAEQAALLSGTDSLPYAIGAATSRLVFISRDDGGSKPPERHYIVMADRDDVVDAMVTMVRGAGLRFASATPIDASIMNRVIRDLIASHESVCGRLFIGRHSSFFALATKRSLRFSRRISLGLESLISALRRPAPGSAPGAGGLELSREQAESLLHNLGIPDPDRQDGWPDGMGPRVALPLLQPVLQRFLIELRQSMRFSIADEERAELRIELCGPGGSIRGMAELLATELAVEVRTVPGEERQDPLSQRETASAGNGAAEAVVALTDAAFLHQASLLPRQVADARKISRASRWLWAGAAAAIAVVVGDALMCSAQIEAARREVHARQTENSEQITLNATRKAVAESAGALRSLENSIAREIGAQPRFGALMRELTLISPASIRLTSIAARRSKDNLIEGRMTGYGFRSTDAQPGMGLDEYVGQLSASPLLHSVTLKNVHMTNVESRDAQQFDMAFTIISTPTEAVSATPARTEGGRP